MTVRRSIPSSLAAVVADLELHRPTVVTRAWLSDRITTAGLAVRPDMAIRRLRELGWLLPLRVQGVWEFAPADRAGPFSGGDPFIEVRALAAVRPDLGVRIGLESAAFLRSLASRQPTREVLILDIGTPEIRALNRFRRVHLTLPDQAYSLIDGLAVQTPAGILAAIAIRPSAYRDWPGVAEWLPTAARDCAVPTLAHLLAGRPAAAWARAAYLLSRGGNQPAAARLHTDRPAGTGPFFLGPRRNGVHDAVTDVIDSVVARYAQADQDRA